MLSRICRIFTSPLTEAPPTVCPIKFDSGQQDSADLQESVLSIDRYQGGTTNYLEVLDGQRARILMNSHLRKHEATSIKASCNCIWPRRRLATIVPRFCEGRLPRKRNFAVRSWIKQPTDWNS